jgi:HAD superfamily hydrolase (TIGR01509 family)
MTETPPLQPKNESIDVILFDLGGVLIELGPSPLPDNALPADLSFSAVDWLRSDAAIEFEKGRNSADSFARSMIAELDLQCSVEQLIQHFTRWPTGLFPGAGELLQELRQNYRLAILTNTNELHWPRFIAEYHLPGYVEHIFASHQLAMAKPEPAIYRHVFETLDTEPGRILFVDDNAVNIEAALELGFQASRVIGFDSLKQFLMTRAMIHSEWDKN